MAMRVRKEMIPGTAATGMMRTASQGKVRIKTVPETGAERIKTVLGTEQMRTVQRMESRAALSFRTARTAMEAEQDQETEAGTVPAWGTAVRERARPIRTAVQAADPERRGTGLADPAREAEIQGEVRAETADRRTFPVIRQGAAQGRQAVQEAIRQTAAWTAQAVPAVREEAIVIRPGVPGEAVRILPGEGKETVRIPRAVPEGIMRAIPAVPEVMTRIIPEVREEAVQMYRAAGMETEAVQVQIIPAARQGLETMRQTAGQKRKGPRPAVHRTAAAMRRIALRAAGRMYPAVMRRTGRMHLPCSQTALPAAAGRQEEQTGETKSRHRQGGRLSGWIVSGILRPGF